MYNSITLDPKSVVGIIHSLSRTPAQALHIPQILVIGVTSQNAHDYIFTLLGRKPPTEVFTFVGYADFQTQLRGSTFCGYIIFTEDLAHVDMAKFRGCMVNLINALNVCRRSNGLRRNTFLTPTLHQMELYDETKEAYLRYWLQDRNPGIRRMDDNTTSNISHVQLNQLIDHPVLDRIQFPSEAFVGIDFVHYEGRFLFKAACRLHAMGASPTFADSLAAKIFDYVWETGSSITLLDGPSGAQGQPGNYDTEDVSK